MENSRDSILPTRVRAAVRIYIYADLEILSRIYGLCPYAFTIDDRLVISGIIFLSLVLKLMVLPAITFDFPGQSRGLLELIPKLHLLGR